MDFRALVRKADPVKDVAAVKVHVFDHLAALPTSWPRCPILLYLDAFGMARLTAVGTENALDMGPGSMLASSICFMTPRQADVNVNWYGKRTHEFAFSAKMQPTCEFFQ
jgi:hypothetical protein